MPVEPRQTTIGVLLFGDFPSLARRVLSEMLLGLHGHAEIRVAANACSPATLGYVHSLMQDRKIDRLYTSTKNVYKYPMMRRMLYDPVSPVATPYFMWFDDDSCITPGLDPLTWLKRVEHAMSTADMIGAPYTVKLIGNQHLWIRDQPWYTGMPSTGYGAPVAFCTGGWWTIRTELLRKHNWPIPQLRHRGGDVMLGALFNQQKYRRGKFRENLWINANEQGRESDAPRRGHDELPIGTHYNPGRPLPELPMPLDEVCVHSHLPDDDIAVMLADDRRVLATDIRSPVAKPKVTFDLDL